MSASVDAGLNPADDAGKSGSIGWGATRLEVSAPEMSDSGAKYKTEAALESCAPGASGVTALMRSGRDLD